MSSMTLVTMEATTEQLDRFGAASEAWDGYANTLLTAGEIVLQDDRPVTITLTTSELAKLATAAANMSASFLVDDLDPDGASEVLELAVKVASQVMEPSDCPEGEIAVTAQSAIEHAIRALGFLDEDEEGLA